MENAQNIINEVSSRKIKYPKKMKKSQVIEEKKQIKEIIFRKREKNPGLTAYEVSNELNIPTEDAEKYLNEFIKESKKKEEKVVKKDKISKKLKENNIKFKEKLKKIFDDSDRIALKDILAKVLILGVPLNFAIFVVSKGYFEFNYYTWIGWGLALQFIKRDGVDFIRSLWIR